MHPSRSINGPEGYESSSSEHLVPIETGTLYKRTLIESYALSALLSPVDSADE
ncbi:hypothetical protein ElyMa_004514100 [Elysia marginata]|uniref:Uncharacterized protein n=1 Tax=Elysia marginata TaxID=1093978 RepID=A0AAV4HMX0_9GAST|nr:hypothetical protein ElyMa_004514100 [Elysia marginata]